MTLTSAPIGVFDSGVGGLTVLRALHAHLPTESTIYLGDTARLPYGPKSPETVRRYAREASDFLVGQGIKALVIACNTATAHACEDLAGHLDCPVIGVVEPGAAAAASASASGAIGVIGTRGTIDSGSYETAIRRLRPDAVVRSRACPLFVSLAEEGWTDGPVARLTAEIYLRPLLAAGIDTLVLGCTHYPLLAPLLSEVVGPGVTLVDSADATARATAVLLREAGLAAAPGAGAAGIDGPRGAGPSREYFVTDDAGRLAEIANRFLSAEVGPVSRIELGA
jgi:glutamate racemase